MESRFLPLALGYADECELFMLPGVDAALDAFTIGPLRISRLPYGDWHIIEKTQFADDLRDVYTGGRPPLYCVFGGDDPSAPEAVQAARTRAREAQVQRLTLTLRLTFDRSIPDPASFIVYRRSQGFNRRDPRSFGRLAYNLKPLVKILATDVEPLAKAYQAMDTFDNFRRNGPLRLAITLFNASYDIALAEWRDRILLLLGALEALTDGKEGPLNAIRWPDNETKAFLEKFRRLRNEVAHGGEDGDEVDLLALRQLVRCLICEGVTRELLQPFGDSATGLPLLTGMRDVTAFGVSRLAEVQMPFSAWET